MKLRIIDLETQNNTYLGSVASPYCPDNYVVMAGWRDYDWDGTPLDDEVQYRYFESREEAEQGEHWFNLDGVDILVAHNAMYEMSWFFVRYRDEFVKFLKRGGRVLCTQMAEYLLSHQTHIYPALDEVAPKYGGTQKVDAVKILWEQGYLTSQIDRALLHEYLCGPGGDIENTAKCFFGQRYALHNAGMSVCYYQRCEAMIGYSMCETNGLYVNQEVAYANMQKAQEEIVKIEAELAQYLPELPESFEFNWGSRFHLSALLYGGGVKYQEKGPYDPPQYVKADFYKTSDGALVLKDSEGVQGGDFEVYKSGKNKGLPKVFREDTAEEKLKWHDKVFQFPGVIDIQKLPDVLRNNFKERGEWRGAQTLADETPVYSTAGDVLETLATHGLGFARLLSRLGDLRKDIGTYYLQEKLDKDGNVKERSGVLAFVGEDSIIHHSLNACATITTRLSSSKPNLQQLPRGDVDEDGNKKSHVKEMFTSRFGDDGVIIEVDYSALEVVMLAAISGCKALLQYLLDGTDMHCLRLAGKLNEPYEEVLRKCKDESHPEHDKYKQMRTEIKPVAFAAQYGASAHGLVYATGCTMEYATEFLAAEAKLFPRAIEFRSEVYDEVCRTGARNIQREQRPNGSWMVYHRGHWQAPGGTCYSFREHERWNSDARDYVLDYKPTEIANYWCQGESGYMMAVSFGRVARFLLENDFFGGKALLINNVHDAVYLDCHKDVAKQVALEVRRIMSDAPRYMSENLGYNIAHVPFPAVAEMGASMAQKSVVI